MQNILNMIYNRAYPRLMSYIQERANAGTPLCDLQKASFKNNSLPDYEDEAHAMLYLLRYGAAYLSEYYLAFKKILASDFFGKRNFSILSIGSGSNLDGLGATLAIKDSGEKREIVYQGIDKANWPLTFSIGARFYKIIKDIANTKSDDINFHYFINIVSFPKLLSEVNEETLLNFLSKNIMNRLDKKFCLIFSNRNARTSKYRLQEIGKINRVLSYLCLERNNITLVGETHLVGQDTEYANIQLHNVAALPLTAIPVNREIISICDDPGRFCINSSTCNVRKTSCPGNGEWESNCCRENIGRYPIKKASYFDTHVYFLEYTQ